MTVEERKIAFIAWAAYGPEAFDAKENAVRYAEELEQDRRFRDNPLFRESMFRFETKESFGEWRRQNGYYSAAKMRKMNRDANQLYIERSTAPRTSGCYNAPFNKYEKFLEWIGNNAVDKRWIEAAKQGIENNNWPDMGTVAKHQSEETDIGGAEQPPSDDEGKSQENDLAFPRNRIAFGAPGTGKSHRLNEEAKKSFADANSERVTFYATYSYAQFVGTYKPVMKDVEGQEKISYEFVPGPFLRMLVNALKNPNEKFLLIIEEINRANAAAVFGDMFQLLDRDAEGKSEYAVATSEDVRRYLVKEGLDVDAVKKIRLPGKLYIWATMNSADQGVFPLDTAFKRRWSFEYIGIDDGEPKAPDLKIRIKNQTYDWKLLRKFLNRLLILNGVNEDKLMGPFFLKNASEFNSKVLMYLWEDAARMCRRAVFGEIKTYSDLCDEWKKKGVDIFEVAKFNDDELKGCLASLLPAGNTPPKDGVAPAQETNND